MTWDFDAGESGTTIMAEAIQGSERSEPYTINTPKVTLPGWAGTSSDWSGSSGVRYEATLDWPVSLETTRTLARMVPPERVIVAESGLSTPDDLADLARYGARSFLIGESLMRADDVAAATRDLISNPSVPGGF